MPTGTAKPKHFEKNGEIMPARIINRELQKFEPVEHWRRRQCRPTGFGFHENQRTQPVPRDEPCRSGTEFIIEYFQAERSAVAGGQHRAYKSDHIQRALAGE